ncbi:MAG: PAS domain-containing protein, partial [Verrucomicrobiota bacterium]|nr:PAS domain-containing protein [Verrucomicrobiota bacterium]
MCASGVFMLGENFAGSTFMPANSALSLLLLGAVLLAFELGHVRAAWLTVLPGLVCVLSIVEQLFHIDLGIDEFLNTDSITGRLSSGSMSLMMSASLLLACAVLFWKIFAPASRRRILSEACAGSVLASVGFSTLVGYVANLPAIYHWGSVSAMSPAAAISLLVLGLALLALAWRENSALTTEPPDWLPLPVAIASGMLTLVLWTGLREREIVYLSTNTQVAINNFAGAITHELDRQLGDFERIARRWDQAPENATAVWETDATTQFSSGDSPGCVAIEWVDATEHTAWISKQAKESALAFFDHSTDPARAAALSAARLTSAAVISGTVDLPTRGPGFVIYIPVYRGRTLAGFVAGEFAYRPFFDSIAHALKLTSDYRCAIHIVDRAVYEINASQTRGDDTFSLEQVFSIADRRLRISLTPLPGFLQQNHRYLPELALASGLGITLLLGLSVHLARSARAGQRAAELSNRKLLGENEERRRVEGRLKISDERLRLALDSTQIGIFEWQPLTKRHYYSPSVWSMLGYDPADQPMSPDIWTQLIHPDDLPRCQEIQDQQLRGETLFIEPEYRVRAADGSWRWVCVRSRAFTANDEPGEPVRIIGTIQDITTRIETEAYLRRAKQEADAASRAKSEFLASMSHEIRTPMNGVIGMTSLLMETSLTQDQQDLVGTIRSSGEALLTIINDILDFSKIESGKMELERTPFDLPACIEEAVDLFATQIFSKKLEIDYTIDP